MNIQRRQEDLETVFNNRWKANNYNTNGVKEQINQNKEHFNRMYNIKSKEDQKREILRQNSVNGRLERLQQDMDAMFSNNRNNMQ